MWIMENIIKKYLLEILFPDKCIGCQTKGNIICNNCVFKISKATRETTGDIIGCFDYRELIIKKAIWDLKYHHKKYLGLRLGELLYETLLEDIYDIETYTKGSPIIVIPVPMSIKKINTRKYNQAYIIAKGFCSKNKKSFILKNNIIFKGKDTLPQAKITNRKRRLENIKGVFNIKNSKLIKNKTIIIIDDVTTTGGTINEIIKILKKSGAKKVIGFAVAH